MGHKNKDKFDNVVETQDEDSGRAGINPYQIYSDLLAQRREEAKKKKKKQKDDCMDIIPYDAPSCIFDVPRQTLLIDQTLEREGNRVPEFMLLNPYQDSGFFFGVKRNLTMGCVMKPANEDGHILVVGGPGSHKTSALIVPTLKTWRGITIAVDIKKDHLLWKQWNRFNRYTGKRVKVFSPSQEYGCGYDPYSFLRNDDEENLIHNVRELALALLAMPPETKDPIWRKGAQNILTAAILYYFDLGATFTETMTGLQFSTMEELFDEIEGSDNLAAKMYIKRVQGVKSKTSESAAMDLADLISFTTDPLIRAAFSHDNPNGVFNWSYLNATTDPFDVILEIPEDKLEQWEQMTTLMINQLIKTLERRSEKYSPEGNRLPPILIMLDEFPRLGKVDAIRSGLATLRSRGVTFCLVIQFLSQLDELYGKDARRIIVGGCSYKAILNASETEDQQYFSAMIGSIIVPTRSLSASHDPYSSEVIGYGRQVSESSEPIVHPHEFATLNDIILMTPDGFCRVDKVPYYKPESHLDAPPPLSWTYSLPGE